MGSCSGGGDYSNLVVGQEMKVLIVRELFFPRTTIGVLYIDGQRICYTLEDRVREKHGASVESWKIPRETAVPVGTYKCIVSMSHRFKKLLPELLEVPGFAGVRIHGGNDESNTEGCILVGMYRKVTTIHNSAPALYRVQSDIVKAIGRGEEVTVEVRGLPKE